MIRAGLIRPNRKRQQAASGLRPSRAAAARHSVHIMQDRERRQAGAA